MIPSEQLTATLERWNKRTGNRSRNERLIREKKYFDIDTPQRVEKFLSRRGFSSEDTKEILKTSRGFPGLTDGAETTTEIKSLERILGTNDLVGVAFLESGLHIARTVGRIWICGQNGKLIGYGTGFSISPNLIMTNHHVLPNAETAKFSFIEFNYQMTPDNTLLQARLFNLIPSRFFIADKSLDYAVVAVNSPNHDKIEFGDYAWNRLSKEMGKTIISQWLNIIQHPEGQPKQVGLRENQLIDILDDFVHYKTDTVFGSSGSPVYNEQWEVVAIHHSGVKATDASNRVLSTDDKVWTREMGEDKIKWAANEGVRISSILNHIEQQQFNNDQANLYAEVLKGTATSPLKARETINKEVINTLNNNQVQQYNADGSVTWNIPVSVTIKVGGAATAVVDQLSSNGSFPGLAKVQTIDVSQPVSEKEVLLQAKNAFMKRGDVLNVRLGYVFENGWITRKRALVVTVLKRKVIADLNKEGMSALPKAFLNYPIEVSAPTFAELISYYRGEPTLESLRFDDSITSEEILYKTPPPDTYDLKEVTGQMKITLHVSPEQGWKNLRPFLQQTSKTLTIAIYDFGARHILETIKEATHKRRFELLTMAIQPGESLTGDTKKNDIEDKEVVKNLKQNLRDKYRNAWVKIGEVNGWVSRSYHIKVAVRDHKALWLSSGNWQSSNQPDIESLDDKSQKYLLNNYNREWHAIIENENLSKIFEKYILYDYENNKDNVPGQRRVPGDNEIFFLVPDELSNLEDEAAHEVTAFEPLKLNGEFKVKPLLTPDNFHEQTLRLINEAQTKIYIQNQTFNAPTDTQEFLSELVRAVLRKQDQRVEVKIIFRLFYAATARKNLEDLVALGFKAGNIKVQKNCHTKGIIVDDKKVLIGSQNWSNLGVSTNRDASLLFDNTRVASYFKKIFLYDWDHLAKYNIGNENISADLRTTADEESGFEIYSLKDILNTL